MARRTALSRPLRRASALRLLGQTAGLTLVSSGTRLLPAVSALARRTALPAARRVAVALLSVPRRALLGRPAGHLRAWVRGARRITALAGRALSVTVGRLTRPALLTRRRQVGLPTA